MPFRAVYEPLRVSQEAFLARVRRERHTRYAYLDGIVTPVPQESAAHTRICTNLMHALTAQLKGSIPICQVFAQPLLAVAPPRPSSSVGMFTYPAIAAVVGAPEYADAACTALRNPTLIVEVTSPQTEDFAMDEKFLRYRRGLPSLQEYVLIAANRCEIGHYRLLTPEQWPLTSFAALSDVLIFNRMPVRVALSAVYGGVFAPSPDDTDAPKEEIPPWQWYDR